MTRLIIFPIILGAFILSANGCKKDDDAKNKPSLTTAQVNSITPTTSTCGGNITADGGAAITARGVVWDTALNPSLEISTGKTSDGTGIGSYTSNLTNLTPNITYYVRAYATNSVGTTYGTEQNFRTLDGIALLTTNTASNINLTTAICGGNISVDGGATITARGVVWNTTQNPTVVSNTGKTSDGLGVGNFTSSLTGLTPNTTYYVCAYATNSIGTQYGNQVTFTTPMLDGPGNTITDADGNVYNTVWIGGRQWMKENLKATKYNDGTSIPLETNNAVWAGLSSPAYCWYSNNQATYSSTYGALYNWYAVNTGKLCPTGWHVPTYAEWSQLTSYLGGESVAGGKLKEIGTAHWSSPNTGATNETNFTALPGGFRSGSREAGIFGSNGFSGYWWSASQNSGQFMHYDNSVATGLFGDKEEGLSVRCIKD